MCPTPSPGWRPRDWWPVFWRDLRALFPRLEADMPDHPDHPVSHAELNQRLSHYVTHGELEQRLRALGGPSNIGAALARIEQIVSDTNRKVLDMSVNVDKLNADIQTLITGYQAVVAERDALKAALAAADANQAAAVAAEHDADQAAVDAADQVVADFNNPPAPPADGGSAPADGSGG